MCGRFSPQNGMTAIECISGGCRECLAQTEGARSCPVVSNGPPIVAESASQVERSKLMDFNPSELVRRVVTDPESSEAVRTLRGAALMLSAIMKSLPLGKLDTTSLDAVESYLSETLAIETSTLYAEMNPLKSVDHLMMIGVLMNQRRAARAVHTLLGVDVSSLRGDEVYLSEAADILSKSARAFSEADRIIAQDVSESFRLFMPSLGSKQRIASQTTLLRSMTVAINGFFTARLLL
jgi:hypothetical protein